MSGPTLQGRDVTWCRPAPAPPCGAGAAGGARKRTRTRTAPRHGRSCPPCGPDCQANPASPCDKLTSLSARFALKGSLSAGRPRAPPRACAIAAVRRARPGEARTARVLTRREAPCRQAARRAACRQAKRAEMPAKVGVTFRRQGCCVCCSAEDGSLRWRGAWVYVGRGFDGRGHYGRYSCYRDHRVACSSGEVAGGGSGRPVRRRLAARAYEGFRAAYGLEGGVYGRWDALESLFICGLL